MSRSRISCWKPKLVTLDHETRHFNLMHNATLGKGRAQQQLVGRDKIPVIWIDFRAIHRTFTFIFHNVVVHSLNEMRINICGQGLILHMYPLCSNYKKIFIIRHEHGSETFRPKLLQTNQPTNRPTDGQSES